MEYKDYYKILEVERDVSQADLKKSYRKLARKYHPDVSKIANAEERFKEVNEAYEVLGDEEKRSQYDTLGANWKNGQDFNPPPGWEGGFDFSQFSGGAQGGNAGGFSDFFESMFGGGFQQSHQGFHQERQQKPPAEIMNLMVTLEDVYSGKSKRVRLPNGSNIEVKIPKNIDEGKKIRLAGKASTGGDLHLKIQFSKHPRFKRDGKNISLDLKIAPWEAALGTTAQVETLGGKINLKIPAGAESGKKMRLKGRGLPGSPNGDQFVVLQIITPPAESEDEKQFYQEMQEKFDWKP